MQLEFYKDKNGDIFSNCDIQSAFFTVSGKRFSEENEKYLKFLKAILVRREATPIKVLVDDLVKARRDSLAAKLFASLYGCPISEAKMKIAQMAEVLRP